MTEELEVSTEELYVRYVRGCEAKSVAPMSKSGFVKAFLRENPQYSVIVKKIGGKSVRCFSTRKTTVTEFLEG